MQIQACFGGLILLLTSGASGCALIASRPRVCGFENGPNVREGGSATGGATSEQTTRPASSRRLLQPTGKSWGSISVAWCRLANPRGRLSSSAQATERQTRRCQRCWDRALPTIQYLFGNRPFETAPLRLQPNQAKVHGEMADSRSLRSSEYGA
jgi:hypothetical protein